MKDKRKLHVMAEGVLDRDQEARFLFEDRGRDIWPAEKDDPVGFFEDRLNIRSTGVFLEENGLADVRRDLVELEPVDGVGPDIIL